MDIQHIDHLVLTVKNIAKSCDFYHTVLGMEVVEFGKNRKALAFGSQKINLHQHCQEHEPKAQHPTPGSADICFISGTSIPEIISHLKKRHINIIEGPVKRTGAIHSLLSVYFRDPDNNLIEIANITPSKSTTEK